MKCYLSEHIYQYDAANRVKLAAENPSSASNPVCPDAGSSWCQQFSNDAFGNRLITQRSNVGSAPPPEPTVYDSNTNRITQMFGGSDIRYDFAGNLTKDGLNETYAWDAEGRMVAFCPTEPNPANCTGTWQSGGTVYTYDGEGRRVTKKDAGGTVTTYVYDTFGQLAAEYGGPPNLNATPTQYLMADMLGSTRLVTDGAGVPKSALDYRAYGELVLTGGPRTGLTYYYSDAGVKQEFTGKERDAETGLDYFGARYMSAAQGRFTSPDEPFADQGERDPQSWNLFSYGRNNPLRFVDPTGRCSKATGGYTDEGSELLFPGPCSGGQIGETPKKNPNSVTVTDFEPPSPLLLAVAQGAQRAEKPVNYLGAGLAVGGVVAGIAIAGPAIVTGTGLTTVNLTGAAQSAALVLPAGAKLAQVIARSGNSQFIGNPQAFLSFAREFVTTAIKQGTYVSGDYISRAGSTIYRVGNDFMTVARNGQILSYVPGANAGGVAAQYTQLGGK